MVDITNRKLAEIALRNSEYRYRMLFEQSPLGLAVEDMSSMKQLVDQAKNEGVEDLYQHVCDNSDAFRDAVAATHTLDVNEMALKLYGVDSKDDYILLMDDVESWWNDKWTGHFARKISNLADTGESMSIEVTDQRLDGSDIVVRSINRVLRGYEETWSQVLLIEEDVSERAKAEEDLHLAREEAEKANRTKGDFLANVSHELRTPLNAIIGLSSVMANETYGPVNNERYREYVKDIKGSGEHLLYLVNDIIDLSVIDAGKLELTAEKVDIATVLDTVVRMSAPHAEAADVQIVQNYDDDLPDFFGDTLRLKQILINLVSNAVKFTPATGKVTISATTTDDGAFQFVIRDTGMGMSEEEIDRASVPFSRGETRRAKKIEGTGLGLPLIVGLVKAHGGTLDIDSTPGKGTTVTVRMPPDRTVGRPRCI